MLTKWKIKGLTQKLLSSVPGGVQINDWMQLKAGGLRDLDRHLAGKVQDWLGIVSYLQRSGVAMEGASTVEVGSGWIPTVPICFALSGMKRIYTFDITRHLRPDLTMRFVVYLESRLEEIAQRSGRPLDVVKAGYQRLRQAQNVGQLLTMAGIDYRAPGDASATGLPEGSVDIFYSNSVLEHIPAEVIGRIMDETRRVLKPDGVAVHAVACNDHYAHFDRSISFINFLQYTEREWRLWNNDLHYQNRLRASQFLQLAREAGLEVAFTWPSVRPGSEEALQNMRLAPDFTGFSHEDLITTTIDFLARHPRQG